MANLWTPESHYSVRTSMYNPNARSQSVSPTQQASLLVDSVDSSKREALINQITEQQQVLPLYSLLSWDMPHTICNLQLSLPI